MSENAALITIAEFVYQVIKNGDHERALDTMDLSDDGFQEDLHQSGLVDLLPNLAMVL